MTTYRITTNGKRFRVEVQYSGDLYQSWTPCQEFLTLAEAKAYRDKSALPPDVWVPIEGEEVVAA